MPGPARDIVALNAGAALYAAGRVPDIGAGIEIARGVLASGRARDKIDDYVRLSQQLAKSAGAAS